MEPLHPQLLKLATCSDADVRTMALIAIGARLTQPPQSVIASVVSALSDEAPAVRCEAISLLAEWGVHDTGVRQVVAHCLGDHDPSVRVTAIAALRDLQGGRILPLDGVIGLLTDSSPGVVLAATNAVLHAMTSLQTDSWYATSWIESVTSSSNGQASSTYGVLISSCRKELTIADLVGYLRSDHVLTKRLAAVVLLASEDRWCVDVAAMNLEADGFLQGMFLRGLIKANRHDERQIIDVLCTGTIESKLLVLSAIHAQTKISAKAVETILGLTAGRSSIVARHAALALGKAQGNLGAYVHRIVDIFTNIADKAAVSYMGAVLERAVVECGKDDRAYLAANLAEVLGTCTAYMKHIVITCLDRLDSIDSRVISVLRTDFRSYDALGKLAAVHALKHHAMATKEIDKTLIAAMLDDDERIRDDATSAIAEVLRLS